MLGDMVDRKLVVSHIGTFASSEVAPCGTVMVFDKKAGTSFSLLLYLNTV